MDILLSTLAIVCVIKLVSALFDHFGRQRSSLSDKIGIISFIAILIALGWFVLKSLGLLSRL